MVFNFTMRTAGIDNPVSVGSGSPFHLFIDSVIFAPGAFLMNSIRTKLNFALVACLVAFVLPSTARAVAFNWSYDFLNGDRVDGRLTADWGATYLENIDNVSWILFPFDGTLMSRSFADSGLLQPFGPQLIPIDGSIEGLRVSFEQDTNGQFDFNFSCGPGPFTFVGAPSLAAWYDPDAPVLARYELGQSGWKLSPVAAVADSGTTLVLLGFALGLLGWMRYAKSVGPSFLRKP